MQSPIAAPRDDLTLAQLVALVESESLSVSTGLELLDVNDELVEDISDDLEGGQVDRNNFADIHGTAKFTLAREIDWGSQRLAPYMTLTAGGIEARFNLGVYLPDTPERVVDDSEQVTYQVEAYDKLVVLRSSVGETYRVAAGTGGVEAIRSAIEAAGESKHLIEATSDAVLDTDMVWPIADESTWLRVVNDIAAAIGYRAVWVDWDGYYRSEPQVSPSLRAPEWAYDADAANTIVGASRTVESDFFNAPNRWVGIINDPLNGEPVEGAGIYTVDNDSDGATSIVGRGGRVIPRILKLDAVDQESLVTQVDRIAELGRRVDRKVHLTTGPMPLHWHWDVVTYTDANAGLDGTFEVEEWSLPFGGDMTHRWREVA